jgi:hypothetical protein
MNNRITQVVTAPPCKRRKGKVAVVGDKMNNDLAKQLAKAIVKTLDPSTTVYTLTIDTLGKAVRSYCKRVGIKTYKKKIGKPEGEYGVDHMQELAVARFAWKVERLYCVYDSSKQRKSFARYGVEIGSGMSHFFVTSELKYNELFE